MRIRWLLPVLAVTGGIGAVSVAGAASEHKVYVGGTGEFCFTTTPGKETCDPDERADLTIATGDTVTWVLTGNYHNAAPQPPEPSTPPDATWDAREPDLVTDGTDSYTFGRAGVYRFVCQAHPSMVGSITVEGETVETPTPTPSPTATVTAGFVPAPAVPTAPAEPTPTDDHTRTPAPGSAAKDAEKPRLTRVRVRRARAGLRVRFRLSEPATVAIKARRKGSRRVLAAKVVQAPAGTHSLTLRSRALRRKGSYRVTFAPVDAMANRGATVKRGARVR